MAWQMERIFETKTRDQWDAIMLGTDIRYAPVLNFHAAIDHPHNRSRATFVEVEGLHQAAAAPRFSRTSPQTPGAAAAPGAHTNGILAEFSFGADEVRRLREVGAVKG